MFVCNEEMVIRCVVCIYLLWAVWVCDVCGGICVMGICMCSELCGCYCKM